MIGNDGDKNKLIKISKFDLNSFDFKNAKKNINFISYKILTPSHDGISAIISDLDFNRLNNNFYESLYIPLSSSISMKNEFINYISSINLEFLKDVHDIPMYFDVKLIQEEYKK
ncbi:hypothetical protein [Photobacterium andalusiense]|uniref:Uncharacterized protein n=1 Tax=Photobacterium andalusiense TaxID=2204296 RepID=A0A1Y6MFZ9_9GAMM|nr:hypothetical protein [Photobacterium andalusiense]SMY35537.1 hypothetical protein PAND9192_02215 [Photobacterium andalusiense]